MPIQETLEQLSREKADAQSKYTYFLLATVGAAIAFSVDRTSGDSLSWTQLPLGSAILVWAFSFWCGCERITTTDAVYAKTIQMLPFDPNVRPNPPIEQIKIWAEFAQERAELLKRAARLWHWQFVALVTGVVLFLIWHVIEMGLDGAAI
jgi:hypothetical protein